MSSKFRFGHKPGWALPSSLASALPGLANSISSSSLAAGISPLHGSASSSSTVEFPVAPFIYINGHASDNGDAIASNLATRLPAVRVIGFEELVGLASKHSHESPLREAAEQYARGVVLENIRGEFPRNKNTVFIFVDERFKDLRKDRKAVKEFQDAAKKRGSTFVSIILASVRGNEHRRALVTAGGGSKEIQAVVVADVWQTGQFIYDQLINVLPVRETIHLRPYNFLDPSADNGVDLSYGEGIVVTIIRKMQPAYNGHRIAIVETTPEIKRELLVWTVCDRVGSAKCTYQKVSPDDIWWRRYGLLRTGARVALPEHNPASRQLLMPESHPNTPRASYDSPTSRTSRNSRNFFGGLTKSLSFRDSKPSPTTSLMNAKEPVPGLEKDFIDRMLREKGLEGNVEDLVQKLWTEKDKEIRDKELEVLKAEEKRLELENKRKHTAYEDLEGQIREVANEESRRARKHGRETSYDSDAESVVIAFDTPTPKAKVPSNFESTLKVHKKRRTVNTNDYLSRLQEISASYSQVEPDVDASSIYTTDDTAMELDTHERVQMANLPRFSGFTEYDNSEREKGYLYQDLYNGGNRVTSEYGQMAPDFDEDAEQVNNGKAFEHQASFGSTDSVLHDFHDDSHEGGNAGFGAGASSDWASFATYGASEYGNKYTPIFDSVDEDMHFGAEGENAGYFDGPDAFMGI